MSSRDIQEFTSGDFKDLKKHTITPAIVIGSRITSRPSWSSRRHKSSTFPKPFISRIAKFQVTFDSPSNPAKRFLIEAAAQMDTQQLTEKHLTTREWRIIRCG